jgi:hypothetical protein
MSLIWPRRSVAGRAKCRRPAIELEHQLLAVDVIDLDADLCEPEAGDDRQRRTLPGETESEAIDAARQRPVEQGVDDPVATSSTMRRFDAVADDSAVGAGGEDPRPDDPARPVRLGLDDRPAE